MDTTTSTTTGAAASFALGMSPGNVAVAMVHQFRRAPLVSVVLPVRDVGEAMHFWQNCVGLHPLAVGPEGAVGTLGCTQSALDIWKARGRGDGVGNVEALGESGVLLPPGPLVFVPPLAALHAACSPLTGLSEELSRKGRAVAGLCGGDPRTNTTILLLEAPDILEADSTAIPGAAAPDDQLLAAGRDPGAALSVSVPSLTDCYGWIARRPGTEVDEAWSEAGAHEAAGIGAEVPPLWATDLDGNCIRLTQATS